MYQLSDQQIDYIFNDIRARGVELKGLQENLLDHVCCIIEQNLEVNGDFQDFYQKTIKTFYKDALWEIEEETLLLLTFKNYYTMKKILIMSGMFSAFTMLVGIWFKYMHWPGAGLLLPLGIFSGSLIFMPLLFTLKAKEQQKKKDKIMSAAGALATALIGLSFVFKILSWPHSIHLIYISAAITLLFFLPIYLVGGIRNPERKVNTIITSLLIIMGYGLLFSLISTPAGERSRELLLTRNFLRSEEILRAEKSLLNNRPVSDPDQKVLIEMSSRMDSLCEELKSRILELATGYKHIDEDFENKNILLTDHRLKENIRTDKQINEIISLVESYNSALPSVTRKIPTRATFMERDNFNSYRVVVILNEVIQLQMYLLQNERQLIACK